MLMMVPSTELLSNLSPFHVFQSDMTEIQEKSTFAARSVETGISIEPSNQMCALNKFRAA